MAELSVRDFGAYFEAVHSPKPLPPSSQGVAGTDSAAVEVPRATPFPWQSRLLEKVARDGCWPKLLDLPTGTGKTASIDVALFHLALDAAQPPAERIAPRRIVMVVDRRTVVDQAFERAERIQKALLKAKDGVLKVVADRLRSLSGTDNPLALAQLRGGMPRDDAWAKRPDQPLVAVSTVDQVGSRLLFRGYGVSESMRPIHAGLLGNDALLLLDEVHLSEPFRQTLEALSRYRGWGEPVLPSRWQFVKMSATPSSSESSATPEGEPFGLSDDDRGDERLARRLAAKKPVELAPEVKASGGEPAKRARFAEECAERAVPFAIPGRAVGVIVNRVATAREVFAEMRMRLGDAARIYLVTGRMRPLDRDDLDKEIGELVRSGRERRAADPPVVVVATQCIEAGADFDFDAIVTECASLDALRQRFGRLNRIGAIDNARGVVLVRSDTLKDRDPIYGSALADTWKWLNEGARDFGIDAMALPVGEALSRLLSPKADAPVMLPAHLDAWVQTMPEPVVDPDVSLWLHGIGQEQVPEVQIVWRADMTEALLELATRDEQAAEKLSKRIEACPPVGLEAISVPIYAARAWLRGDDAPDLADVEGRAVAKDDAPERGSRGKRYAFLWKGDDSRAIEPHELRPDSTLVVPSTYGGIDPAHKNWDPYSKEMVSDRGDEARWQQTRRPTLRLHPHVLQPPSDMDPHLPDPPALADPDDPEQNEKDRNSADDWLDRVKALGTPAGWRLAARDALPSKGRKRYALVRQEDVTWIDSDGEYRVEPGYITLVGRFRAGGGAAGDVTTEGEGGSLTGVEITLRHHLHGVASWAKKFAAGCGLPPAIAHSVVAAARWHDLGKVDTRFQRLLCGGDDSRAVVAAEPLAKSKIVLADRAARRRAFKRSGYPRGTRHELSSVAMLQGHESLLGDDVDPELVLHLVASHHGWCRPFAPVAEADPNPVELTFDAEGTTLRASSHHGLERLDSGIADRFWRLVQRYGWFGLAWLEAILRLSDHRRSEQEQVDPDAKEAT